MISHEAGTRTCDSNQGNITATSDEDIDCLLRGAAFGPANTIMQVVRFIDPDWLVEIRVDAIVEDEDVAEVNDR